MNYYLKLLKVLESAIASSKVFYTVKKGDTVSGVASRYSVSVNQIKSLSELRNVNLIYVGQLQRIK
ncbi:MAG: LysM domain-containing protein [Liquorilactobacillus ghanensis]